MANHQDLYTPIITEQESSEVKELIRQMNELSDKLKKTDIEIQKITSELCKIEDRLTNRKLLQVTKYLLMQRVKTLCGVRNMYFKYHHRIAEKLEELMDMARERIDEYDNR